MTDFPFMHTTDQPPYMGQAEASSSTEPSYSGFVHNLNAQAGPSTEPFTDEAPTNFSAKPIFRLVPSKASDPGIGISSKCSDTEEDFVGAAHLVKKSVEGNMHHQPLGQLCQKRGETGTRRFVPDSVGATLENFLLYPQSSIDIGDFKRHLVIVNKASVILPAFRHHSEAKASPVQSQDAFAIGQHPLLALG
ncbi:hypothetical protein PAXINDRAFT_13708 [Paxillus involutus ATCC 200175]|uniref:Unplaced genomic scaffold PAXINscaffold_29, whole genome shotgun sequence n=1 Tax=Paxillus involutus ATCC 200175 TaxID=664439 RepID=A0A0C9U2G6_PAXIN|nr:hypothetical protein PAXINDRAFT_13708 [Paxillus involutus ATCC 200175]